MNHRRSVAIEDISVDERIPHAVYRPTFVKSLAMVPIRTETLQCLARVAEYRDGATYEHTELADVDDALTSTRPYKAAWTHEQARAERLRLSGRQSDPAVVAAFTRLTTDEFAPAASS